MDFDSERLLWATRVSTWPHPVPPSYEYWIKWNVYDDDLFMRRMDILRSFWDFLKPFFATRGYALYEPVHPTNSLCSVLPPKEPKPATTQIHPYARIVRVNAEEQLFDLRTPLAVWPARDAMGQDVIIKVVSGKDEATNELKALRYLNSRSAREDPRNHTIHVVDFIELGEFVFVVMPRWDPAFRHEFMNLNEVLKFTETFLEVFEFLHDNRIAHCDFIEKNTGLNAVVNCDIDNVPGLRDPAVAKYALFDFGNCSIYPKDTDITSVVETRHFNFYLRDLETEQDHWNPFEVDIIFLGAELQFLVRHIENFVPEIGPFLEKMTNVDNPKRPTAREALQEFRRIYSGLTSPQLSQEIETAWWTNGKSITKAYAYRR
ncbi:hypothetical protein NLJ89_g6854 [Agrocybe chaxingu]|uniref:Protein kinase domain-containing protein n=1 Tax=Agrocybe chaxingu TaxID=84603 RepID=A0A9W8JYB9_9AGAR|nr:hypothetical protein NLJ89_g6854 [Agrocybe chaxingu]